MTSGHGSQPVVAGHATQGRRRVILVACTPMGYNIAHLGGVADTAFRAPTWFRELSGAVATSYYTGPGTCHLYVAAAGCSLQYDDAVHVLL